MNAREGLIPMAEVAALGVSRATVQRWVAAERLHALKFERDRQTYVRRADLEALLQGETRPAQRGRPGRWRTPALLG